MVGEESTPHELILAHRTQHGRFLFRALMMFQDVGGVFQHRMGQATASGARRANNNQCCLLEQ